MRFRLPKPLHGWRQLFGEVGIIVVGVLIALGAQQVVEGIHDREEVTQLRAALRGELADARARWENIRAQDGCTMLRLDMLDRWATSAPPDAKLGSAYRVFLWNMHSSAWDIAKTAPAAAHIPIKELLTYSSLYAGMDNWRQFINEENANIQTLNGLLSTADQPENRRQIRLYLAKARSFVARRKLNYPYFFARFDELGIKPDTSQLTIRVDPNLLCKPLDS